MMLFNLRANFLPKLKKFRVEMKWPGQRWVELMTIAQFLRFARNPDTRLKIGGTEVVCKDEEAMKEIRAYLRTVAESYVRIFYRKDN